MIDLRLHPLESGTELDHLREILARAGYRVDVREDGDDDAISLSIVPAPVRDQESLARRIEELERTVLELRNLDAAKSQFLTNVSHELRTPLTAVVTYGEVLRDGLLGELEPRQKDAVKSVIGSARQLLGMIEEILIYAKANARGVELDRDDVEVADVIADVYDMNASLIKQKELRYSTEIAPDLPPARADRDKMIHVLGNLIGNAIEFTPAGGEVVVTVRRAPDDPAWLEFVVADSGIGIDSEHHDIIFEAFAQVDSSRARKHHGTGLGLSIARNFIRMHGGDIWVDSTLGEGSRFIFRLPSPEAESRQGAA